MNALAIATTILGLLQTGAQLAPITIDGIENATTFGKTLWKQITGDDPSPEDEAKINAALAELSQRLQEPLPPAQPGDPDFVPGSN